MSCSLSVRFRLRLAFSAGEDHEPMNDRCAEFQRLHVASGWNQARTARELGLDPSSVSFFLQGKATPRLTVLRLLAGLIGDRVLLPGEAQQASVLRDGPRWLEDWEADVVTVLRRLEPGARKRVISAVREIIEATAAPIKYREPKTEKTATPDPIPPAQQIVEAMSRDLISPEGPAPGPSGASSSRAGEPLPRSADATESAPSPGRGRGQGTSRRPRKRSVEGNQTG